MNVVLFNRIEMQLWLLFLNYGLRTRKSVWIPHLAIRAGEIWRGTNGLFCRSASRTRSPWPLTKQCPDRPETQRHQRATCQSLHNAHPGGSSLQSHQPGRHYMWAESQLLAPSYLAVPQLTTRFFSVLPLHANLAGIGGSRDSLSATIRETGDDDSESLFWSCLPPRYTQHTLLVSYTTKKARK